MTDYDVVVIGAGVAGLPAGYAEHEDRPVRRMKDGSTVVVEVTFNGWDTHANNFAAVEKLSKALDAGFASLLGDLEALREPRQRHPPGDRGHVPQDGGGPGVDRVRLFRSSRDV